MKFHDDTPGPDGIVRSWVSDCGRFTISIVTHGTTNKVCSWYQEPGKRAYDLLTQTTLSAAQEMCESLAALDDCEAEIKRISTVPGPA
jgi:hypothetical protein